MKIFCKIFGLGAKLLPRLGTFPSTVTCHFSSTKSEVVKFYNGKNIFITGATGFLGKVLVEKLLTTCPDVGRIYILLRGKRNLTVNDRLEQLCNEPIFMKYRRVESKNMSKIVVIEGQFSDNGIEMSNEDRQTLTDNVNIVFHIASTIRFNEPLEVAMKNIFIGTKTMLTLASKMHQLSSFVCVSTAFSHSHLPISHERVYDMKIDADSIMSLYKTNSKENVETVVRRNYFEGRPNTYTFVKALTENYIREQYRHLPVTIARPSVVAGALNEPEPGYCDSPAALGFSFIYQGLGISRYQSFRDPVFVDVIPVDIAINSLLVIAREVALQTIPVTCVYNVSSTDHWTQTHKQVHVSKIKAFKRAPPAGALRPFSYRTTNISKLEQFVVKYFSELPFAVLMDMISNIRNKKSRMVKLTKMIQSTRDDQVVFYNNSFLFPRKNMDEAIERLSKEDRKLFPVLPIVEDIDEYWYKYWLSLRELKLGEKADNIEAGQRHHQRLLIRSRISFAAAACFVISASCIFYDHVDIGDLFVLDSNTE